MTRPSRFAGSRLATALLGASSLLLVILILTYPDHALQASLGGLRLWWTVLLPGLLPYLVFVEIIAGMGLIRALGALVEPALRRWFRLPSGGGPAVVAGFLGGFPYGAQAVRKHLQGAEGTAIVPPSARLLAMSHMANPALIVTVVGAGMLQQARMGFFLALIHYVSLFLTAWITGVVTRRSRQEDEPPLAATARFHGALQQARQEDSRRFGQLLGDAVTSSIQTLFVLSGVLILFSVVARLGSLLLSTGSGGSLFLALPALLEPHLGSYAAAVRLEPSLLQLAIIGAALAWGGISQHLQLKAVAGLSSPWYSTFLSHRLLQVLLAAALTVLLGKPLSAWLGAGEALSFLPAFAAEGAPNIAVSQMSLWGHAISSLRLSLAVAGTGIGLLCLLALLTRRNPSQP
ncbi:sporulation protein [Gorillibacterium sp. CAU 1737]|uniref:sporulation protein n=1 Tax=Gorillibacterium sp. CAU 1737 TaxID=3140362 RepID=UPI0032619564